ncbi:MerR family transcriptional regulator [Agromyces seonyuensis]|uniref:MerR family transcriptional regulator n=1 Tax=Agromyces seonyuensis TaxID=2662446 RepID=A0A6I4NYS6_9MICO|nr:MerR family transcriptional regulator [Agromyces seonyuensis]
MDGLGPSAFERASGLTRKALRLYEVGGLLVPESVDPATGYRRYAPAQLERARAIGLLRRLRMPLAEIRTLLEGEPDALRDGILAWQAGQAAEFARRSQLVDRLVAGPGAPVPDALVRIETAPARTVAAVSRRLEQPDLVASLVADRLATDAVLRAAGARPSGEHWAVFRSPVGFGLAGLVEVCVPYTGRADPVGDIVLRAEPARRLAVVDVRRRDVGYPRILEFYDAVRRVANAVGGATDDPRERYPSPWSEDPDAIVLDVALPIAGDVAAGAG